MADAKGFKDRNTGTVVGFNDTTARAGVEANAAAIAALGGTVDTYARLRTRNLIDAAAVKNGYIFNKSHNQYEASENWAATDYIPVEAGKKYSFSYDGGNTMSQYVVLNSSKEYVADGTKSGSTITVPADATGAAYLILQTNNATAKSNIASWQLEEGIEVTEYVPYYVNAGDAIIAQGIGNAENKAASQKTVADITGAVAVRSNNLIDTAKIIANASYNTTAGGFQRATGWYSTDYIPVTGGMTYAFGYGYGSNGTANGVYGFNADKAYVSTITSSSGIFTVPATGVAYVVLCSNNATTVANLDTWTLTECAFQQQYKPYYIPAPQIPAYVDAETERVKQEICETLTDGDMTIFGFNTDQHITVGAYSETSVKYGLKALEKLTDALPFNFVCLGGDDAGYRTADTAVSGIMADICSVADGIAGAKCPIYNLTGNHDAYQNNSDITSAEIFTLMGKKVVLNKWNGNTPDGLTTNFWYDDAYAKIRFVFVDTNYYNSTYGGRSDYTNVMCGEFITAALSGIPEGYKCVLLSHHALSANLDETVFVDGKDFAETLETYAAKIICCISGHAHKDGSETKNGILYIQTTTAGMNSVLDDYTRTPGTAAETAFDVFMIDQTAKKVYAVRYGAGNDRTFDYDPESETFGEIVS